MKMRTLVAIASVSAVMGATLATGTAHAAIAAGPLDVVIGLGSFMVSTSSDGSKVLIATLGTDVPGARPPGFEAFDLDTGAIVPVGGPEVVTTVMSRSGRFVAFASAIDPSALAFDVFVLDTSSGARTSVSTKVTASELPIAVSDDGAKVLLGADVLKDVSTGATTSVRPPNSPAGGPWGCLAMPVASFG